MSEFDDALVLEAGVAPKEHQTQLDDQWMIGDAVNGGLLMALAATALGRELDADGGHLDPLALSAYFLSPAGAGETVLRTHTLRVGRQVSTDQVSLLQRDTEGREVERLRALATFGDLDTSGAPVLRAVAPPRMPSPDECLSRGAAAGASGVPGAISLTDRLDLRLDPSTIGWVVGRPAKAGRIRGWFRFRDGREPDPISLLLVADAFPPVAFDLGIMGWAPTLEFTAHVRGKPAPGWLQVVITSANFAGGLMEEDALVWDSTGRLVVQSRQLVGVRVPKGWSADEAQAAATA